MKALAEHARDIAETLSESLSALEVKSTLVDRDIARLAIHDAWLSVVDDFANGRADLSSDYLADVHLRLATKARLANPGGFTDRGLPELSDGGRESWSRFAKECHYDETDAWEEEYALAQLRWGEHVKTFALTLGWFALNIVRLRRGEPAIYPPPEDHDNFLQYLRDAGPDDYDAETGLRGLAREYAKQQSANDGAHDTA